MENRIKVGIRARPLNAKELETCTPSILTFEESFVSLSSVDGKRTHRFDWCFGESASQDHVYQSMCKPLIDNIFEDGQSGSGKTYTMGTTSLEDGIIPSALIDIFQKREELREKSVKVDIVLSVIEIYRENCYDLLSTSGERKKLVLGETKEGEVYAEGVTKHEIGDIDSAAKCLSDAAKMRATAATAMNSTSSRSHAICTLTLKVHSKGKSTVSKLNLVDLAGSERVKKTGATGNTFKEGVSTNKSLSALGNVVAALTNKDKMTATARKKLASGFSDDGTIDKENVQNSQSRGKVNGSVRSQMEKQSAAVPHHVPYRESKLTHLLKDSLGGNGMTVLLTCVSPAESNLDETSNSLKFASRASSIVNKAKVNVDKESMSLQKEIQNHKETLDKSHKSLDKTRLLMAEKDSNIEELNAVLNEKEDAISELHIMLQHKEYAIISLKEQLHERDARINRARELEGTNESTICELSVVVVSLQEQLHEKDARIRALEDTNGELLEKCNSLAEKPLFGPENSLLESEMLPVATHTSACQNTTLKRTAPDQAKEQLKKRKTLLENHEIVVSNSNSKDDREVQGSESESELDDGVGSCTSPQVSTTLLQRDVWTQNQLGALQRGTLKYGKLGAAMKADPSFGQLLVDKSPDDIKRKINNLQKNSQHLSFGYLQSPSFTALCAAYKGVSKRGCDFYRVWRERADIRALTRALEQNTNLIAVDGLRDTTINPVQPLVSPYYKWYPKRLYALQYILCRIGRGRNKDVLNFPGPAGEVLREAGFSTNDLSYKVASLKRYHNKDYFSFLKEDKFDSLCQSAVSYAAKYGTDNPSSGEYEWIACFVKTLSPPQERFDTFVQYNT